MTVHKKPQVQNTWGFNIRDYVRLERIVVIAHLF